MNLALSRPRTRVLVALLLAVLVVVGAAAFRANASRRATMPTDSGFESRTGVRVTRVAVVGDGGLVDMRYVVLDAQKATKRFANTKAPPHLVEQGGTRAITRVAAMRQAHELRPGQTYYLIYLNTGGRTKPGDTVHIDAAGDSLAGVPVQ